ncbi:MAG TPA: NAD(P)-dependent oxidoreductase [Phycisphaerae bacterium]|nr:NAD(P)-dependent oxidoreductase [Phycisphaerae bacterium]
MKGSEPYRILLAEPFNDETVEKLRKFGEVILLPDSAPETMLREIPTAHAILVRLKAHVTARIIEAAPLLKVIGRASPTIDHIDLKAARKRSIPVVYCPTAAVNSTAEFAFALILAARRRLLFFDTQIRDGRFENVRQIPCRAMNSCVVGLLGTDLCAARLARIITASFGSTILYHDPIDQPKDFPGQSVTFAELLARSDVLSVHLPLTTATRAIINADRLASMKRESVLVNVTRGATVDTTALADALKRGVIAGAALDVFETEPIPLHHPLRRSPNCVLTPHVAGMTQEALDERCSVADDVIRVLQGEAPKYSVGSV